MSIGTKIDECDLILVAGVQGSGKTKYVLSKFCDQLRLNTDEIRYAHKRMTAHGKNWTQLDYNPELEEIFREYEQKLLRFHLRQGQKIVVDNTNVTCERRRSYIDIAKSLNKTIGIVFLNTPLHQCLAYNKKRDNAIPESIVKKFHKQIELPTLEEGFDYVIIKRG